LKEKLNRCFVETPLMAKLAFPFILDKLQAPQIDTKIECLQLIQLMIKTYEPFSYLEDFLGDTLNMLENEYIN
jgi:hypothetical protein